MNCEFCEKSFEVPLKGSGGKNRKFCFDCLPENLTREERNLVRRNLYHVKHSTYKIRRGCDLCGYNRYGGSLEWHHPTKDKIGNVSDIIKLSWDAFLKEASKCNLLCACCHRELHADLVRL